MDELRPQPRLFWQYKATLMGMRTAMMPIRIAAITDLLSNTVIHEIAAAARQTYTATAITTQRRLVVDVAFDTKVKFPEDLRSQA